MKVVLAPEALEDLEATAEYIDERNPSAASRLVQRVLDAIDHLADGDFDGPEALLRSGERVQSWPVPPLRIYYQREEGALLVLRLYHQDRRPIAK